MTQMDTKAGRAEVATAMQQKANGAEMAARLAEVGSLSLVRGVECVYWRGKQNLSPGCC